MPPKGGKPKDMNRRRLFAIARASGSTISDACKKVGCNYLSGQKWDKEPEVVALKNAIADQQIRMAIVSPSDVAVKLFGSLEELKDDIAAARNAEDFKAMMKGWEITAKAFDSLLDKALRLQEQQNKLDQDRERDNGPALPSDETYDAEAELTGDMPEPMEPDDA